MALLDGFVLLLPLTLAAAAYAFKWAGLWLVRSIPLRRWLAANLRLNVQRLCEPKARNPEKSLPGASAGPLMSHASHLQ